MKNVIKEVCIMLLLCVAVLLIFAVIFYEYVPINKVVPNKVAYKIPNEVKEELDDDITVEEKQPKQITYSVTADDLRQYKEATVYQPGNPNPFQSYITGDANLILGEADGDSGEISYSSNGIQYYYGNSTSGLK